VSRVRGHVVSMSQHKFASNVVEKCIAHSRARDREDLVNEMLGGGEGGGESALEILAKDQLSAAWEGVWWRYSALADECGHFEMRHAHHSGIFKDLGGVFFVGCCRG
jgi:hypothetical protein